jgi:hypothetical protein
MNNMAKIKIIFVFILGILNSHLSVAQSVKLSAKVFLSNVNPTTMQMTKDLSMLSNFPLYDPYSSWAFSSKFTHVNNPTVATISPSVLANTGSNAVIDWIFVELRQASTTGSSTTVVSTKAGILRADGEIVDTDMISPLQFLNTPPGPYYVAVRHRNHLGFRTTDTVSLSSVPTLLNFTNNSVAVHGTTPLMVAYPSSAMMMVSGDANSDGSVDSMDDAIWEYQNGSYGDYNNNSDFNIDGSMDGIDSAIWELNNGKFEELH